MVHVSAGLATDMSTRKGNEDTERETKQSMMGIVLSFRFLEMWTSKNVALKKREECKHYISINSERATHLVTCDLLQTSHVRAKPPDLFLAA